MALDYHAIAAATDRGSAQATTDIVSLTDKRDVSDMLDLLALADTPFINRIGWGSETGGNSIEWISEDLGPGYVVAGSALASASVVFNITTCEGLTTEEAARQLQTGTILYHYSSTDGEHALLVLVSVGTDGELEFENLTVGTAIDNTSMVSGDKLFILGAIANEGSLPRTGNWRSRVVNSNGFSILRQDVQITGSQKATDMYAIGREDTHQIRMRLKELTREREKQALYAAAVTKSTTVAGMMNGALGFLITQAGDNISTETSLTKSEADKVIGAVWESGGTNLTFFGHKDQCAKFSQWDYNRIRTSVREGLGGGRTTHYLSEVGLEVEIVPMRKVPKNIAFLIDTSKVRLKAKRGRKGIMEKLGKAGDFEDWQIISEFSFEMQGYNLHQHGLWTRLA